MEEWRDIPGFEGYQASTLGRVKSLSKRIWNGKTYFISKEKIIGSNNGERVNLRICGKSIQKAWFVAMAFQDICGEWFPGEFVDHIDTNPSNDRPENLRWVKGQKGNMSNNQSRVKMSLSAKGNKNHLGHHHTKKKQKIYSKRKKEKRLNNIPRKVSWLLLIYQQKTQKGRLVSIKVISTNAALIVPIIIPPGVMFGSLFPNLILALPASK